MVFAYFNTCLLDNALEEWHSVTPHEDNQTVENFKFFLLEWFNAFLPNNTFLTQKEWMTNTTKNLYTLKVKDFGNISKTLNCFLTFMPNDHDNDTAFSDTDLKALLFKSMPLTWHNAYLLKCSHISDDFWKMQSYFVQFKSITDNQTSIKTFSATQRSDREKQHKYIHTNHGWSGHFLLLFRLVKTILTKFCRRIMQLFKAPLLIFKTLSSSLHVFPYMEGGGLFQ